MAPRRRLLLWGSLALTLVAVAWVDFGEDAGPAKKKTRQVARWAPTATPAPTARAVPDPAAPTLADLARRKYAAGSADLFPARGWQPAAAITPAGPVGPPPLPFAYIGKLEETGGTVVFLLHAERTLAVRQGNVIDGTYRVEKITPQSIVLRYLPLKQQQSLDLGSAN